MTRFAEGTPRVWAVMGYRAGENSQILALAEALGWPFEVKTLCHRRRGLPFNLLRRVTARGIDRVRSSPLVPPWPDLIISAGFRNEPVVRWIKAQTEGRCRIVHIGRPWAGLDHFDLVITTPQYRLPLRKNVLHNGTTLHRVTPERLEASIAMWRERLSELPRPRIAVLVGGDSGPYAFGNHAAARLGRQVNDFAQVQDGSLLVTTSARTDAEAADVLETSLDVPAFFYRWRPDAEDNPYYALLAMADSIVVTGDSIAMLSEAVATGKPMFIFDLGVGKHAMRRPIPPVIPGEEGMDFKLKAFLYRQMMRLGPERLSRDVTLVHAHLVSSGRATWLGDDIDGRPAIVGEAVRRSVERVKGLLAYRATAVRREGGGNEPRLGEAQQAT